MTSPLISFVIPTLGRSPLLGACLAALREEIGGQGEIILVDQSVETTTDSDHEALVDRVLRPGRNLGFAGGTNTGVQAASSPYLATINDDAVIEAGWSAGLLERLEEDPTLGSVQGLNLLGIRGNDRDPTIDGMGICFNRWWQANQIGHGVRLSDHPIDDRQRSMIGVSATAAIYRRSALDRTSNRHGRPFDETLGSYYEDVDLACRLHAAGFGAACVQSARAWHAGSTTGRTEVRTTIRQRVGNRYLVLARHLGRGFFWRLPTMMLRDGLDLLAAPQQLPSYLSGWGRAIANLGTYSHLGQSSLSIGAPRPRIGFQ